MRQIAEQLDRRMAALARSSYLSVSGNWRITFRFVGKDAEVVDYEDYH